MNLEGRLLGNRYEIMQKIGNGGMAMVYKAKCHVLNRYVAVKILRDEFTTDEEFIKRFEIEAQAAASITHPNIVSVYDVGREGNLYYIVMELIKGKTLKEIIIEEGGPLPWKWSVNIAIQIASALDVAHKNNIVHRDIKPHNIIITEDGVAKVTDFGIAKAVSNSTMTAFGTTIGSVHYFSPEHARGGFTDAKSDIYSLGVVMYEMLTGRVPFDADTPVSVALKHMQEEPISPNEINEKIPKAVNDIILKAMRKDVSLRYQNATAMLSDLNKALKNPEGDFVDNSNYEEDFPTQKISTEEIEEAAKNSREVKDNFIKRHKGISIFIGIVLLFVLSLGGTLAYLNITVPKETTVPNLVGVNKEEAKKQVEDKKLVFEIQGEEYNSQYAAGKVISQEPIYKDNYNVKEGTTVKVKVSLGMEETTVPKVAGMSEEEAISALEEAKLKYEIVEENSKKVEAGYVINQETTAGTKVFTGDIVRIHVSTGPDTVEVVSVIEKTEEDAKKELTDLGLKVNVLYEEDATKNNGTVLKQSINGGEKVEKETNITLTVNKISETKSATITVNVKSLLGGKVEYEDEVSNKNTTTNATNTINAVSNTTGNETTNTSVAKKVKKVQLRIMVGNDKVFDEKVDPTTTNQIQSISGKGTVTIKVYIDEVLKSTKDINLNTTDKLTIE